VAEQRDHSERTGDPDPGPTPADGTAPVSPPPGSAPGPAAQTPAPQQNPAEPGTALPAVTQSGAQPPALPQPSDGQPALDPEQLRQFQQFQQFQDYLRFTQAQQGNQPAPAPDAGLVPAGAQQQTSHQPATQPGWQPPVPPGPPGALAPYEEPRRPRRGAPRWLKRLGGKVLGWVIVLLLIAIAATWAYRHFFPSDAGKSSAQIAAEGGGTYHTNQILTTASPYESVRRVYDGIAQHGPGQRSMVDHVCGLFDQAGQQQFAADLGYPTCAAAVPGIHDKMDKSPGSVDAYAESIDKHSGWPPGDTVQVNSCAFTITGGPALGDFAVKQVEKGQWLIVGHSRGPSTCTAPPTTTG
jgi:hypothetical protein